MTPTPFPHHPHLSPCYKWCLPCIEVPKQVVCNEHMLNAALFFLIFFFFLGWGTRDCKANLGAWLLLVPLNSWYVPILVSTNVYTNLCFCTSIGALHNSCLLRSVAALYLSVWDLITDRQEQLQLQWLMLASHRSCDALSSSRSRIDYWTAGKRLSFLNEWKKYGVNVLVPMKLEKW